jgi:hypothetical protein
MPQKVGHAADRMEAMLKSREEGVSAHPASGENHLRRIAAGVGPGLDLHRPGRLVH